MPGPPRAKPTVTMSDEKEPSAYYENARLALLDMLPRAPLRLLDVGCGNGATGAAAKARWPELTAIGIEMVPEAAQRAAERLDRVVIGSAETLDWESESIAGVDAVLLADVLEHLVDPWRFLKRLRTALSEDAVVVASIPNVANFWLLEELAAGRFDYASEGLLDATHLRFFTRATISRMFNDAGYTIERWDRTTDGRVDDLTHHRVLGIMQPVPFAGRVTGRRIVVRDVDEEHYQDLRTIQFFVVAHPLP
jgi:O-antigen biosynthesis protein